MDTVDRIVTAMGELVRRQGYAATGMAELARVAGAPNGSVYHHFRGGKRDVAAQALRTMGAAHRDLIVALLDEGDSLPAAVTSIFIGAGRVMEESGWATMCPVATVSAEVADSEPALREIGAEVMSEWLDVGQAGLRRWGLGPDDARATIHAMLAGMEGAFLTARVLRSREPFEAAGRALAAWVETLPANASVSATQPSITVASKGMPTD